MSNTQNTRETINVSSWILKREQKFKRLPFIFTNDKGTEIYTGIRKRPNLADHVYIIANKEEILAAVKRKYWAIRLTYALFISGKRIALLKRTFDATRFSFKVDELGLRLVGETNEKRIKKAGYGKKRSTILEKRYLEYEFRLIDNQNNTIMEFCPDLDTGENRFLIKIYDVEKELICLCLVLAVCLEIDEMNRPDL